MTLRKKVLIIMGITFFGLISILYFTSRNVLLESLNHIEEENISQDVKRTLNIFSNELVKLDELTSDWASWDDTYEFIVDNNKKYIEANLVDDTLTALKLNFIIFVNLSGQIVFCKGFDLHNEEEIPIPEDLVKEHLFRNSPLIRHESTESSTNGLLLLPERILLIASRPILTSKDEGPIRGALIFGRYLDDAEINRLAKIIHLPLTVSRFNDSQISSDFQTARSYLSKNGSIFIRPLSEKSIAGYALLRDIYGNPALLLRVEKPRVVYQQGKTTIYYFVLFLIGACLASCIVAMLSIEKQVLSRLANIGKTVSTIATTGSLSERISVGGKDELSRLGKNINEMFEKLDKTQKELRATEKKYRELVENANSIILRIDINGRITFFNEFAQTFFGYSADEILGSNVADTIIQEKDSSGANFMTVIEDMKRHREPYTNFESENIRRNGEHVWIAWTSKAIYDKNGGMAEILFVGNDITGQKRVEAELLKAQKLESIGILAGGIAHDFNNILTAILGNITLAKMDSKPEDKVFQRLAEAEKACVWAKDLTQQLLTFSKGGAPIKKTVLIQELIKDSVNFTLSGSNVRCKFSIPDDLWQVEIDEGQISQVINNLVVNAEQAMPEGGIIEVKAENISLEEKRAVPLKAGKYIRITIKDEGIGIPEEHLPKIFDPYFTTKQKGSGLGLAVAHSIIKNHAGYITVESKLGAGTSFYIYLPASEKGISERKTQEEKPLFGQGRILVMDDEPAVREIAGNMLQFLGYEVEFAREGAEAIELYKKAKKSGKAFDAVILDLTVPGGMGGKEAIRMLLEIDPDVRAIVSSGYSNDPVMSDFKRYGFRGVVAKPYNLKNLAEEVHKIIAE